VIDDDRLEREYAELRANLRDPRTRQVVDDLDRAYAAMPPARLHDDMYAAIRERAAAFDRAWPAGAQNTVRGRAARRRLLWHWRPLAVGAVALALAAGVVGVPLAQNFASRQQATDAGGAWSSLLAHAGTPVGISYLLCGYTVTIDRAYADANDILVGYRVTPPKGLGIRNMTVNVTLQGGSGQPFRGIDGYGMPPNSRGDFTTIESFDASGIAGTPRHLALALMLRSMEAFADQNAPSSPARPCRQDGPAGADPRQLPSITTESAQGNGQQTIYTILPPKLIGPVRLAFTVPYAPRSRVAALREVVHVGTGWLEINSVVVTPAETRVYLRGKVDEISPTSFRVGGQAYGIDVQRLADNGLTADSYVFNLYDKQGGWSFSFLPRQPGGAPQVIRFTVPAPALIGTPIAEPSPTVEHPIGTPIPMPPSGSARIVVGTSPDMKHLAVSFPPDVSQVFCGASLPHVPKRTVLRFRFQRFPYKADYFTQTVPTGVTPRYAYIYGPLQPGPWRCRVDIAGVSVGSADFSVQ
jgi:hypothetical protein